MNKIEKLMRSCDIEKIIKTDIWLTPEAMNEVFNDMASVQQLASNGRLRVLMKDGIRIEFDLGAGKLLGENGNVEAFAKLVRFNTVELGSNEDYILI